MGAADTVMPQSLTGRVAGRSSSALAGEKPGEHGRLGNPRITSIAGLTFTRERSKVRSLVRPPFLVKIQ
jgi:hypothetical protein